MSKKKKIAARRYADLSFQFYRDKEGTPNFLITRNESDDGRPFYTAIDTYIFAGDLVNSALINIKDLAFLCDFFEKARAEALKKFQREDPLVNFTSQFNQKIDRLREEIKK